MKHLILLFICVIGLSPPLPARAQQTPPQEGEAAALKKEVQDLRRQMEEQRRTHEAEMKEMRQQLSELAASIKVVAASQPAKAPASPPPSAADDLAAAIQQAQNAATPAATSRPTGGPSNWLASIKQFAQGSNQGSGAVQSFNPDISLVGDFQAVHDRNQGGVFNDKRIVKEVELGIAGNIDPYVRWISIFSVHPREDEDSGYEIEIEEAYVEPLAPLAPGLGGKLGKFRTAFGKVNELHLHALPWPQYPLVIQRFFGEEGLKGEGASVSWLAPGDKFIELTAQAFGKPPDSLLAGDDSNSFVQLLHLKTFHDLSKSSTLEWGLSGAILPHSMTPGNSHDAVEGMDLTYKWRPQKQGLYRSFKWINEIMASQRDVEERSVCAVGLYSAPEYQFARRWAAGLRYDFTQDPDDSKRKTNAAGAYLTFLQSEFCYWRLGYQISRTSPVENDQEIDHMVFLQLDISLGPHPAHKY